MRIFYTSKFARAYRKLPLDIKRLAEERERWFQADPFDPRLDTHKLHGRLQAFWSFSIDTNYRIVFEFSDDGCVYFHTTGTHDLYR